MSRTYRKSNNIPRKYRYKIRPYNRRYEKETYSYFLFEKEKLFDFYSQRNSFPFKEIYDFIIHENRYTFYKEKFGNKAIDFYGPIHQTFNKDYLLEKFSSKKIEWMLKTGIISLRSFERKLWKEDDFSSKDSREGFCIYKTRGKIRNLREYEGLKADRRECRICGDTWIETKIRPRTCPYLIWDDKLTTGFIKKSCY